MSRTSGHRGPHSTGALTLFRVIRRNGSQKWLAVTIIFDQGCKQRNVFNGSCSLLCPRSNCSCKIHRLDICTHTKQRFVNFIVITLGFWSMALDTQSIVAIIALFITCPPTIWILYKLYTRRRDRRSLGVYIFTHTILAYS